MARRWFALTNGLLVATICTATAWGQATSQQQRGSLADRMTALRQGWSQGSTQTNTTAGSAQTTQKQVQQPTAQDGSERVSLMPGWFNRNNKNSTHPGNRAANQSRNAKGSAKRTMNTSQMPPDPATMSENASGGQAGAANPRTASRQSAALPGLGGSPLPRVGSVSGNAASNQSSNTTTPTTQAESAPAKRLNISAPTNTTAKPQTASRQSPSRRTAPHFDPNELRRELAGSFPGTATTETAAAPTAQSESNAGTAQETPANEATVESPTTQSDATSPLALPTTEQPPQLTTPIVKAAPQGAAEAFGAPSETRSSVGTSNFVRQPRSNSLSPAQQNARRREAFGEALQVAGGGDPSVLVSNQNAILEADIRGPKQILVGREAVYRVHLTNHSDFAAEGVVATVSIPSGAEVLSTNATQGMVRQAQEAQSTGQLQWQLARMEKQAGETLEIRLVPRESKPLELGITWTVAPVGSRTLIEVQEPKLQLEVTGPNEVLFDKPQVFKLTLTNPGTGPAEKVKIDLMPPGGGQEAVTSHPIGDLAPGASQTIEVELTARDAGKMAVKAIASAEGGLVCDATKEVFCRKAELDVDWRGPATKYAGTLATYFFRVRNPGTAAADDVTVQVTLPDGAEFMSASDGQAFDPQQKQITWHAGTLNPGDDKYMELKCQLTNPGANQFKVVAATAAGELTDNASGETNVVALADLKLNVTDPSGPVAVGDQAVYEIHVKNSGSSAAKDVNVVALFSEGIEPDQAEGAMYTVADGRVSFRAIDELQAGREVVLRIRAHAVQAGTHVFRAEVLCRDLEIKLAAEETTRFYADDVAEGEQPEPQAASRGDGFHSSVR